MTKRVRLEKPLMSDFSDGEEDPDEKMTMETSMVVNRMFQAMTRSTCTPFHRTAGNQLLR